MIKSMKNTFGNKIILLTFTLPYLLFCFYVIDQYSNILSYPDLYRYFLGDGEYHMTLIWGLDSNFNLKKLHLTSLYHNNYYIFSTSVLKFLKFFPGYDYSLPGISAIITNLISIYIICITGFLICFNLSKSKLFSLGIILLVWNSDLIVFSLHIYPDILQLAFIFLAVYFVTLETKYKYFFSFVFCGLAFGVKAQGLLIFIYLATFYFINELFNNFKNLDIKIFRKILLYTFSYSLLFLITFFALNQIDPFKLLKSILLAAFIPVDITEFDNTKFAYEYFIYLLRDKTNFIIFVTTIVLNFFYLLIKKKKDIFFYVSLIILALFYYQVSNLKILVQGVRYLYHLLPCIIILISLTFSSIREYFNEKNYKIIPLIIAIVVLVNGLNVFNKTFFNTIKKFDFKSQLKNDPMINGYNFLKSISDKYKNSLVCAGYYSPIPLSSGGFTKILKSYHHLDFEKGIRNRECVTIVLDDSTPGRYIWLDNLDNLIIKKYETLGSQDQLFGKEKIEKTQELIKYIIKDPISGYKVTYKNPKIIVLVKID